MTISAEKQAEIGNFVDNLQLADIKIIISDFDGTLLGNHTFHNKKIGDIFKGQYPKTGELKSTDFPSRDQAKEMFSDADLLKHLLEECRKKGIIFAVASKQSPFAINSLLERAGFDLKLFTGGIHGVAEQSGEEKCKKNSEIVRSDLKNKLVFKEAHNGGSKFNFMENLASSGLSIGFSNMLYIDDNEQKDIDKAKTKGALTFGENLGGAYELPPLNDRGVKISGEAGFLPYDVTENSHKALPEAGLTFDNFKKLSKKTDQRAQESLLKLLKVNLIDFYSLAVRGNLSAELSIKKVLEEFSKGARSRVEKVVLRSVNDELSDVFTIKTGLKTPDGREIGHHLRFLSDGTICYGAPSIKSKRLMGTNPISAANLKDVLECVSGMKTVLSEKVGFITPVRPVKKSTAATSAVADHSDFVPNNPFSPSYSQEDSSALSNSFVSGARRGQVSSALGDPFDLSAPPITSRRNIAPLNIPTTPLTLSREAAKPAAVGTSKAGVAAAKYLDASAKVSPAPQILPTLKRATPAWKDSQAGVQEIIVNKISKALQLQKQSNSIRAIFPAHKRLHDQAKITAQSLFETSGKALIVGDNKATPSFVKYIEDKIVENKGDKMTLSIIARALLTIQDNSENFLFETQLRYLQSVFRKNIEGVRDVHHLVRQFAPEVQRAASVARSTKSQQIANFEKEPEGTMHLFHSLRFLYGQGLFEGIRDEKGSFVFKEKSTLGGNLCCFTFEKGNGKVKFDSGAGLISIAVDASLANKFVEGLKSPELKLHNGNQREIKKLLVIISKAMVGGNNNTIRVDDQYSLQNCDTEFVLSKSVEGGLKKEVCLRVENGWLQIKKGSEQYKDYVTFAESKEILSDLTRAIEKIGIPSAVVSAPLPTRLLIDQRRERGSSEV